MSDSFALGSLADTAYLTAFARGLETEKAQPRFRDPLAWKLLGLRSMSYLHLAGPRGEVLLETINLRTAALDQMLLEAIAEGVEEVWNLACGLDTRPYRLELPPRLRWVEVDRPELIHYKELTLKEEVPRCPLRREARDLADADARRALLATASPGALFVTEGFLIYLEKEQVHALARELRAVGARSWLADLVLEGCLQHFWAPMAQQLQAIGAPLRFDADPRSLPGWGPKRQLPLDHGEAVGWAAALRWDAQP